VAKGSCVNMILIVNICKEKLHYLEFVKPVGEIVRRAGHEFFTRGYKEIGEGDFAKCSSVIICGTSLQDFDFYSDADTFSWLKDFGKPVFGICGGCQIIGNVFGGEMKEKLEIGYYPEKFEKEFLGVSGEVEVYHLHSKWVDFCGVTDFEVFCSGDGVDQAVKHNAKPIYGVLFHPEVRNPELIERFCNGEF